MVLQIDIAMRSAVLRDWKVQCLEHVHVRGPAQGGDIVTTYIYVVRSQVVKQTLDLGLIIYEAGPSYVNSDMDFQF